MLLFLKTINVAAILLMLFMLAIILRQQPSRAQTAFILYNVFTIVFVIGVHLELLHADTVGEALAGLCVQYVGQAGFLMAILWFVSEFARFPIPLWVYELEALCNGCVIVGVFTAQHHRLFYSEMEILTDGMYNRIEVQGGVLWYAHYIHMVAVILAILILCAVRYRKSSPVQKKRILYIASGIGALALELLLKGIGCFGSYNPVVIAMTVTMLCMMMAMVRYRYFGSLLAAVDNAFNHGNEGLIIVDADNTVIFINQRMDGLFPELRKGSPISSSAQLVELLHSKEPLLRREGVVYELRTEDIIENGEKNGQMLWFIDQTQALLTMKKLREADEAKTQFLMQVSHELRTPMNTMLGMNEMILRESGEEQIRDYARETADAGAHMLSLIDEVLDASMLETGRLTLADKPYRIGDVLRRVQELMQPQAERKGLTFTLEADEALINGACFLMGDAARLQQLLVNLLANAIKYTEKGYICLKAQTKLEAGEKRLLLSVGDSGIGIRTQEQQNIFLNFERGSNAGGKAGMGLGLAIVKQLADAMEATVTVQSALGRGSVFSVSLPWREAGEKELAVWRTQETADAGQASGKDGQCRMDGRTLLVVDDNEHNLLVLRHLLRRTGVLVETASGGQEAIAACRQKKYDLILMDHMMPEMDGITALHLIRSDADGKNRETKAVALTANASRGAQQMYLSEGFADYVAKPIDPEGLERTLGALLAEEPLPSPGEKGGLECLKQYGFDTEKGLHYADMDEEFYRKLLRLFEEQRQQQQEKLETMCRQLQTAEQAAQGAEPMGQGAEPMGQGAEPTRQGAQPMEQPAKPTQPTAQEGDALLRAFIALSHGLKGEARGLGAEALADCFYALELAGKAGERESLPQLLEAAEQEWRRVSDGIAAYAGQDDGI